MGFSEKEWIEGFSKAAFGSKPSVGMREKLELAVRRHDRLLEMRPEHIVQNGRALADVLGIGERAFLKLAFSQPSLFYQSPKTMAARIAGFAAYFGVSDAEFIKRTVRAGGMGFHVDVGRTKEKIQTIGRALGFSREGCRRIFLRGGRLMMTRPELVIARGLALRDLLDLKARELERVVMRYPALLSRKPESVALFLESLSKGLKVERAVVQKMARRWPQILSMDPAGCVERVAAFKDGFGLDQDGALRAVQTFPALLYLDTRRIVSQHREFCKRIGLDEDDVRGSIVGSAILLCRDPLKSAIRMRLVARIAKVLGEDISAREAFLIWPTAGSYGMERLLIRYGVAAQGLWTWRWTALLQAPAVKIERLIREEAEKNPERREALRALISRL